MVPRGAGASARPSPDETSRTAARREEATPPARANDTVAVGETAAGTQQQLRRRRPHVHIDVPGRQASAHASFLAPDKDLPFALPASAAAQPPPPVAELDRVGSGAGGTVWEVLHGPTGRTYALKILHGQHYEDTIRQQINREIAILLITDSPYVVKCYGMYENAGKLQILLELMSGSLDGLRIYDEAILAHASRSPGTPTFYLFSHKGHELVLPGLAYLHRRHIVYRDLKPANLLTDRSGRVEVADFGVGSILNRTQDPCHSAVGTMAYMSPERLDSNITAGGAYNGYAADIWSFGLTILQLHLGNFPYGEDVGRNGDWAALMVAICYSDAPEPPPTASHLLADFLSGCLQKQPRC
ncbi:hypothetical protein PR202_gb17657 [Eleusine coracana subsp. coracana]|uniref:Protein kinase domain-containing protein n=1 Tax=Eleusine coracana subsp. coracana TaxID=191504 RepID=A0AAV5F5A7_ELECO|nr:hypothetical protein PR202_gb17657 [Eleusine coracana subsp. coracana]